MWLLLCVSLWTTCVLINYKYPVRKQEYVTLETVTITWHTTPIIFRLTLLFDNVIIYIKNNVIFFQGQFVIILAYLMTLLAFDCQLPKALTVYMAINCFIFLYLFGDFYRKAYQKRKVQDELRNMNNNNKLKSGWIVKFGSF